MARRPEAVKLPLRAIGLVGALTLASNLLGFVREVFMARAFGVGVATDAFVVAFALVSTFFLLFTAGTIQAAFMPAYQRLVALRRPDAARQLFRRSAAALLCLLLAIALALAVFADAWVSIVVPGFGAVEQETTSRLVAILAPMVVFSGFASLLQSVAHAQGRFVAPASVPVAANLLVILALATVAPLYGISALAWSHTASSLLWWVIVGPAAASALRTARVADVRAEEAEFSAMLKRLAPLLLLLLVDQLSAVAQKTLVSHLQAGSIAALNYAAKIEGLPIGIFCMAVATVYFPALAEAAAHSDRSELHRRFFAGLVAIVYLLAPAAIFLCMEADIAVATMFERGAFDSAATSLTAQALLWYSVGLIPQGLVVYLNRTYFAAGNTATPTRIGITAAALHLVFCFFTVQYMGFTGIAAGTSLYAFVYAWLLVRRLHGQFSITTIDVYARIGWRMPTAAAAMAAFYAVVEFEPDVFGCAAAVVTGSLVYGGVLLGLGDRVRLRRIFSAA